VEQHGVGPGRKTIFKKGIPGKIFGGEYSGGGEKKQSGGFFGETSRNRDRRGGFAEKKLGPRKNKRRERHLVGYHRGGFFHKKSDPRGEKGGGGPLLD